MKPQKYTTLTTNWKVNLEGAEFASPSKDEPSDMIIFGDQVKDGAISARVTPIAGQLDAAWGHDFCECALIFRYRDPKHFYLAGIGGFGRRFYIARVSGNDWQMLEGTGSAQSLLFHQVYNLRVEFKFDHFTLYNNEVPVIEAVDGSYESGYWGLRCNRTQGEYKAVDIAAVRPKCFVIMPFDPEMKFIYGLIKQTVQDHGLECLRADERFISEPIMEDVKSQIAGSDLVIVDFSNRNPNVYYEAGLADAWKKKWIILAQSRDDLAFDVRHIRYILYSNKLGADSILKDSLQEALAETLGSQDSGE